MRLWSVLLLAPLCACDLFSAEATLDDVCMALDNRTIDGVPNGKLVRTFTTGELGVFDSFVSLDADVTDVRVALKATRGVTDLSFLDSIHISISSQGLPAVDVIQCDGGACASDTMQTEVAVAAPPDLVGYAIGGKLQINLTVRGALPKADWAADVVVCLSGKARVKVGL